MKFSPDACITCGLTQRHTFDSYFGDKSSFITDNRGTLLGLPFWFCSDDCMWKAIDSLLEKRFQNDATPYTDPRCPDLHIEEFAEQWLKERAASLANAFDTLCNRAVGEWNALTEKRHAEKTKEEQREQERLDRIARQERLDAERRERQTKLDARRELDRQEKLRKEAEREQEKQIEQQRRDEQERYDQLYEQAELDHELWVYNDERTPKPFVFPPDDKRMEGTWCLGNSGKGKTNLLHHIVLNDMFKPDVSILCVDNKHDFVHPLKTYVPIQDRLVLIEPKDDFLLALNPLDIPGANVNHVIELIDHLLSSLLEELSGIQTIFFRNVVPVIYDIFAHPTFADLTHVIKSGLTHDQLLALYDKDDARNDFSAYTFFSDQVHGFESDAFKKTREAVVRRLEGLYKLSPIFRNMFNAPRTKLDLGKLFDDGKIILIDANEKYLAKEGADFFQRYILALVYLIASQRSGKSYKRPTFCYFDECEWIREDTRVPLIFDRARSQKIGCIFAHQRLENIESPNVLSALKGAAIKYVNVVADKQAMGRLLDISPELLELPRGVFSASYRDQFRATPLTVPFVDWQRIPQVSDAMLEKKRAQARDLYCYVPVPVARPPRPDAPRPPEPNRKAFRPRPNTHEAPQSEASREIVRTPAKADTPITTQRPSSGGPAPNGTTSSQDHEIASTQAPPDPSAPARWGQSEK